MSLRALALALLFSGCNCGHPVSQIPESGSWDRPGLSGKHVASCDDPTCGDGSPVPVGGDHCPTTLACRKYTAEQKRCSWLHNLEHGHAVLLYNCPEGCAADVAELERRFDAQLPRRILVAPDAKLPRRFAALVWGHGWHGDVLDAAAIGAVLDQQDADAPEPGLACGT